MPPNSKTLALYRRCLRSIRGMSDPGQRWYYKNWARGHVQSHDDEDDDERLDFLLRKGEEHRKWILQKYNIKDPCVSHHIEETK